MGATLSLGAQALLGLLRRLQQEQMPWPGQAELARLLGRSRRSLQLYWAELRRSGLVLLERTCLVTAPEGGQTLAPEAQPIAPEAQPVAPGAQSWTTSSLCAPAQPVAPGAQPIAPEAQPVAPPPARYQKCNYSAAAVSKDLTAAAQRLRRHGVPADLALRLSGDPQLVEVACQVYEHAQRAPPQDRPRSWRFLVGAILHPSRFGIARLEGRWVVPEANPGRDLEARRRQSEAEAQARAEAWYARTKVQWDALTEEQRRAIRQRVRMRWPLWLGGKPDDDAGLLVACLHEMEEARPPPSSKQPAGTACARGGT